MAYVYRHIRLDQNGPFYIGIGKDNAGEYKRAHSIYIRNRYWKNITAKTEYEVEIIIDGIEWDEACNKEKEFIQLYGRRDLRKGPLINLTDGGEGFANLLITDEAKRKMSIAGKNRKPPSAETRAKLSKHAKARPITKEMREKMASKLRGRPQPEWQRKILSHAAMGKKVPWSEKPILQYGIDGSFIKEFKSSTQASAELGINRENISSCLTGKNKHARGYIFTYKTSAAYPHQIAPLNEAKLGGQFRKRKVINIRTGVIYNSVKEAATAEGINHKTLGCKLCGVNKNDTNIRYHDTTNKKSDSY